MVWGGRKKRSLVGGFRSVKGCPPNLLTRQTKTNQNENFWKMEKMQKFAK